MRDDFLFLGDSHLKVNAQQMAVATSIIDVLNSWKIGGITFSLAVESKDLRGFAALFVGLDHANNTLGDLRREITDRKIDGIALEEQRQLQIRKTPELGGADLKARQKLNAKNGYAKLAGSVGALTQSAHEGGKVSFKQAKRADRKSVV